MREVTTEPGDGPDCTAARRGTPHWRLPGPVVRFLPARDEPWLGMVTRSEIRRGSAVTSRIEVTFLEESTGAVVRSRSFAIEALAAFEVSDDGSRLASVVAGEPVARVWDLAAGSHLRDFAHGHARAPLLRLSPEGRLLLMAGGGEIQVLDVDTGQLVVRFPCEKPVQNLLVSPDGTSFVWHDGKRLVRQELSTGPARVLADDEWIGPLLCSPDGALVAAPTTGSTRIVRVVSGQILRLASTPWLGSAGPASAAFSREGRWYARAVSGQSLDLWQMLGSRTARSLGFAGEGVTSLAFSRGGRSLHVGSSGLLERVDLDTGRWETLAITGLRALTVDATGRWMLEDPADHEAATPRLWDLAAEEPPRTLPRRNSWARAVLSTGTGHVAVPLRDGTLEVHDPASPEAPPRFVPCDHAILHGFSPDGSRLLTMNRYQEVKLYRPGEPAVLWSRKLETRNADDGSAAVDPSFTLVAQVGSGRAEVTPLGATDPLWSETWSTEGHLDDRGGIVVVQQAAVVYSAIVGDGGQLVSALTEGPTGDRIVSWDLRSGRRLASREIDPQVKRFCYHLVRIWPRLTSRILLPVVEGSRGGYLIWNAATGDEECHFPIERSPLSLDLGIPLISPCGDMLAMPREGGVTLHALPSGEEVDRIEHATGVTPPVSMAWLENPRRLILGGPGQSYVLHPVG